MTPNRLLIIGLLLVLFGAVMPFLIVLGIVPSTFTLNFLSFAASVAGVFLGILGSAMVAGRRHRNKKEDDWYDK